MEEIKNYCVYKHTSPSEKVYIGISNNTYNRWSGNGYKYLAKTKTGSYTQPHFAAAILKYGFKIFKHEILFENLSREEANQKEIELIAYYKSLGISYNIANGGEGGSLSGEQGGFYGKHHTEEHKKYMSEKLKGRKFSEETIEKMRNSASKSPIQLQTKEAREKAAKAISKAIYQCDLEGNIIKEFASLSDAAEEVTGKRRNTSHICQCLKGQRNNAHGYTWKYKG